MIPELTSLGSPFLTKSSATSQRIRFPATLSTLACRLINRASTRMTFASKIGAGLLKAKLTMAPAVYLPMPGSRARSVTFSGSLPSPLSINWRAQR